MGSPAAGTDAPADACDELHQELIKAVQLDDVESIQRILSRGVDANIKWTGTALHTAAVLGSVDAVRALLDAGAAVDCRDTRGDTPLHASVHAGSTEVLKVLAEHACLKAEGRGGVDVPDGGGCSALQLAVMLDFAEGCRLLLDAGADPTYSASCEYSLLASFDNLSQYTPVHLAVLNDNAEILDIILNKFPNEETINCRSRHGITPLCCAIRAGRMRCVKMLFYMRASLDQITEDGQNALHVAALEGNTEILEFLLTFKDDVGDLINSHSNHGCAPLHLAAFNNRPKCVVLLVQAGADTKIKTSDRGTFKELALPIGFTALHIAASLNYTVVTKAILQLDSSAIHEVEKKGFTPLHVAIQLGSKDVILLLLHNGATLASTTKHPKGPKESKTAIEMLSNCLPSPGGFLEEVFDSFICSETEQSILPDTKVKVNYEVLGELNEVIQIQVIEELVRCGQEKILMHPFLESLLHIKWRTLFGFFYLILATYAIFVLSLNMSVVSVFYYIAQKENPADFPQTLAWNIMLSISIVSLVLQEYVNALVKGRRYLVSLESWVRLGAVLLAVVWSGAVWRRCWGQQWGRPAACAALLLAWTELLFLLSRFPNWGYYVLMFGNVSFTIIKILLTFMILVVAFSLVFMIQFEWKPPFDGPWSALLKTLVMMTSEYDYESLFDEDRFASISTSRVVAGSVFLCFLILMSVVLMNFMVGVAVSDITELNVHGNRKRLVKLVETLTALDVHVYSGALRWLLPSRMFRTLTNKRFVHNLSTFPDTDKLWYLTCSDDTPGNYQIKLPKTLSDAIIKRAIRQKTRQEEQTSTKADAGNIDALRKVIPSDQSVEQETAKHLNDKLEKMSSEITETKQMVQKIYELLYRDV